MDPVKAKLYAFWGLFIGFNVFVCVMWYLRRRFLKNPNEPPRSPDDWLPGGLEFDRRATRIEHWAFACVVFVLILFSFFS